MNWQKNMIEQSTRRRAESQRARTEVISGRVEKDRSGVDFCIPTNTIATVKIKLDGIQCSNCGQFNCDGECFE